MYFIIHVLSDVWCKPVVCDLACSEMYDPGFSHSQQWAIKMVRRIIEMACIIEFWWIKNLKSWPSRTGKTVKYINIYSLENSKHYIPTVQIIRWNLVRGYTSHRVLYSHKDVYLSKDYLFEKVRDRDLHSAVSLPKWLPNNQLWAKPKLGALSGSQVLGHLLLFPGH